MMVVEEVGYESEALTEQAKSIAQRLRFTLNKESNRCLYVASDQLYLKIPGFSMLSADFKAATWLKRRNEGKKQGLVRACRPAKGISIMDATAGWGRDSAVLASFGAKVLMVERNPVMAALLEDALLHRSESDRQRMDLSIQCDSSFSYLDALQPEDYPDVIYIDPMHPERTKSALVKKDMQILQQMIGTDDDALELIRLAITRVKQRVVVKWPQKEASLAPADLSIEGKTVRFDIYFPK